MTVETGKTFAHYRLIEKLGEGGMGVVWKAFDTLLERDVALKFLPEPFVEDPQRLARFEQEARTVAALNHPNIVTVHSVEQDGDCHFISMELVQGRTIAELLPEDGLPFDRFFELAIPMVDAVRAAHARDVVHGDLKPGNVMVTDEGRVKVLDFGLARSRKPPVFTGPNAPTKTLSVPLQISGTVPYMSPEQIQQKDLDARSDIFSLGTLLYEMATGRLPFSGDTSADVIASILKEQPRPPSRQRSDLPRHLDRVIEQCLAKQPDRRIQTTVELRDELRGLARRAAAPVEETSPSIAVLPFVDMSADKDQDYFCEGMADEIISAISRIDSLRVASPTSSFRFKNTTLDSREIGDRLGVGNLLEGSVRKSGDQLRISTQLTDVIDGYLLWAERYDRRLEDVFAIQEEIARNIVQALRVTLSPRERRAIKQVATTNVEAYDYYLRGRQHFRQFRRKSIEVARDMFARAIEIDPTYAGAYAGLADCHSYIYMFWEVSDANRREAERASLRSVELDPDLPEAYVARGVAVSLSQRHEEAAREFEIAIRLNPKLFEAYYFSARGHYARGQLEQAVAGFRQALDVRPEDYQAPSLLGSALAGLGRKAESAAAFRTALANAQKHLEVHPGETRALYFSALALCQLGEDRTRCLELAGRALAMDPDEPQVLYNVGCVHALLGQPDKAIDCLVKTVAHGGWWRTWMRNDPDLVSIHDQPRFRELVREI